MQAFSRNPHSRVEKLNASYDDFTFKKLHPCKQSDGSGKKHKCASILEISLYCMPDSKTNDLDKTTHFDSMIFCTRAILYTF